jgi:pimeloyl-ACP methyl ester carboxylesterase
MVAYRVDGAGRPLVLLHGLMAHSAFFEPQRALADSFRLISVDLRGHGESRDAGGTPDIGTMASDIAALADHLDLKGAVGVGWSLGASVLWRVLGGAASRRFAGAVVIDMTPCVLNHRDWDLGLSREACDARTAAMRDDFPAFAASAGQAIFSTPADCADWASSEFVANDGETIAAVWRSLVEQDFRAELARIEQPTLVVHGALSHLYGPETAEHLVAALPNAAAMRFDRSGHAPHLEQPELFNAALRDFAALLPPVPNVQPVTV